MSAKQLQERFTEFQNIKFNTIRSITDAIIESTIQFFYNNSKNQIILTGSGVLFEIDNRYFVFSAAHVFPEKINDTFFIIPYEAIYLGGKLYTVSLPKSGNRIDDKIDLAVIELRSDIVTKLKAEYKFHSFRDILLEHTLDKYHRYLSVGYPSTKTKMEWKKPIIKTEPFVFNSKPATNFEYESFGFNFNHHIAIEFTGHIMSERSLQTTAAPELEGISGSGMWYLPKFPEIDKVQTKKLIGITIERVNKPRNQALVATRIDLITEFLRQYLNLKIIPPSKKIKINIK
jgi:hypothetical protein